MDDESELKHIGTPRHSGRYPWGSGNNPNQRNPDFLAIVNKLHKQGLDETEIAKELGMTRNQLQSKKTIERVQKRNDARAFALRLKEKGLSGPAIAKRMGLANESSVRALLDPVLHERANVVLNIANKIRERVDEYRYIDIGAGTAAGLSISDTKLKAAVHFLETQGYKVRFTNTPQSGTKKTSIMVLVPNDVTDKEIYENKHLIRMMHDYSPDGGKSWNEIEPPVNINSKRIEIRYKEEGGAAKDGVIELRRNVPDLNLGNVAYAQVRISVDGTHFMKGMAMYSDDVPDGKDIIYNTNKKKGTPNGKVFKPNEEDVDFDNPFGTIVRQRHYNENGVEKLSALNVVGSKDHGNEEGAWSNWQKSLSSQILSKQVPALAKKQLAESAAIKHEEFDEINALTNPVVKKILLDSFAKKCDTSAEDLKAAPLPGQMSHVLLPILSIKEHEVFAPHYNEGESVVLIRHPHGGTFEIPELIVNNKNKEAKRLLTKPDGSLAMDAVGINPKVAAKLSGADFDGDAVIVIPNKDGYIKTRAKIQDLVDFEPKDSYKDDSLPYMKDKTKQQRMGDASNLITDMTIKGTSPNLDEIVRAVKYSMVVIDAQKHSLDYKRAAQDFNIPQLKKLYQGGERAGASTLISKAGSEQRVPLRKEAYKIDPVTGKKIYQYYTGEIYKNTKGQTVRVTTTSLEEAKAKGGITYRKRTGDFVIDPTTKKRVYLDDKFKIVKSQTKTSKMNEADDAFTLSSGTPIEKVYANYANDMKALANKARKTILETGNIEYSHSARITYSKEVDSLNSKLKIALANKPNERQALLVSNKVVSSKRQDNPDIKPDRLKKIKGEQLIIARSRIGAEKHPVVVEDREWEAIQAGAITNNKLVQILLNSDVKALKERALPRTYRVMSPARVTRAKAMLALGHTYAQIAESLGVSQSSIQKLLGE